MEVSTAMSSWPVFHWNRCIVERLFPNTCSSSLDVRSKYTPEQARTRACHWTGLRWGCYLSDPPFWESDLPVVPEWRIKRLACHSKNLRNINS